MTPTDLRSAARALLGPGGEALALSQQALARLMAIARATGPTFATDEHKAAFGRSSASSDVRAGVAVIPLQGIITPQGSWLSLLFGGAPGGLQGFRRELADALGNDDVTAIVLDVHSPGGLIGLVPETAAELRNARGEKPIVAVANTMTASAAYWIAAQADEVIVTPSGFAGSIGVYLVHEDWSGFNEQAGIDPTYISAGRFKTEGNPDEPLSEEATAALQAEVDDLYALFVADVAAGRSTTPAKVRNGYGQGRVLPAGRAREEGLVDRVATIDDVIRGLAGGKGGARRGRRASDVTPTLRAAPAHTPEPNAPAEVAEEVQARMSELATAPPPAAL